ncbi:hypothetical protein RHECNPAF_1330020 [Rhizobium etli CNPAF512]|nr:hypothetical protein RHECNPAF_1330020 [Rhizobium etli CNPAF512]
MLFRTLAAICSDLMKMRDVLCVQSENVSMCDRWRGPVGFQISGTRTAAPLIRAAFVGFRNVGRACRSRKRSVLSRAWGTFALMGYEPSTVLF